MISDGVLDAAVVGTLVASNVIVNAAMSSRLVSPLPVDSVCVVRSMPRITPVLPAVGAPE